MRHLEVDAERKGHTERWLGPARAGPGRLTLGLKKSSSAEVSQATGPSVPCVSPGVDLCMWVFTLTMQEAVSALWVLEHLPLA